MNILLNFPRHVEVDHILDIRDVKPTRQHRGCCQYGGLASTEVCQGLTDKDPFIFEQLERVVTNLYYAFITTCSL